MRLVSSLTNRIFAATAVLVVVTIAVAIVRVNVEVTRQVEADLQTGLREGASLVDEYSRAQFDQFSSEARLVCNMPDLKNAVSTDDAPTVAPIALEYQRALRADVFVVLDRTGRVLAEAARSAPVLAGLDRVLAARGGRETWTWPYTGGVLELAAIPMEPGPATLGTVVVGTSVDEAALLHIRQLTNSDLALAAGGQVVASTLPADRAAALGAALSGGGTPPTVHFGGDDYAMSVHPLTDDRSPDAPVAVVLRSRTARLRVLQSLHTDVIVTGGLAVLLATLVAYLIARTVTRPLRALTATMGEMAATGDLAHAVPATGAWDDEDARLLARTFRRLTSVLDRLQREAAQRERLSSLGRLSTVIAHEVRNPLMIIKTALRSLRREPSPETVQQAATSIDEEVGRLNRLVSDVLDFARPIPVALASSDLVEICQTAVRAAHASAEDIPLEIDARATTAPVVTDAERLRSVLVNLLVNAQAAVRAIPAAQRTPVVTRIARGDGHWVVEVLDRGAGIAPDDLARIFEPFFTTKRGGSGLGLAISRNIVESLGGTIAASSAPGAGTTVRIVLPIAAPPVGATPRPPGPEGTPL